MAAWMAEAKRVVSLLARKKLVLSGDCRCDSPGYSAKYGTYTFMDTKTDLIVDFELVQCTETTSSVAMEKTGFQRALTRILSALKVATIVTDRSRQITALMRSYQISHQYDVWHFAKSIAKKIRKAGRTKANAILLEWLPAISNHIWWSAKTCEGDKELLREKWTSLLYHVVNRHSWAGAVKFKRCAHPRLTRAQQKKKKWIQRDSAAYSALEAIVNDKTTLRDIEHLSDFCHTGNLEVYHNVMTKYCPKREHFSHASMVGRTQLAALDHNQNIGRQQATTQAGELRYRTECTRQKGAWVAKKIYEKKEYGYLHDMVKNVALAAAGNVTFSETPAITLPPNLTGEKPPPKEDIVHSLKSRLK